MGHPPAVVWKMTPKRIDAMLFIARKRRNAELLELFKVHQLAQSHDEKSVKDFMKAMQQ